MARLVCNARMPPGVLYAFISALPSRIQNAKFTTDYTDEHRLNNVIAESRCNAYSYVVILVLK